MDKTEFNSDEMTEIEKNLYETRISVNKAFVVIKTSKGREQ
jgi:hypothetical protein